MKPDNLEQLAREVSPQNARSYALAKGWERVPGVNGGIALFKRADSDLAQLIIPVQSTGPDHGRRIVDLVSNLAEWEHRPPEEILSDLLIPEADIVRYRVVSPDTARGDMSLEDGLHILEGARRSLLAAACSVLSPAPYHPRMARTEATQLLSSTFAVLAGLHRGGQAA